MPLQVSVFCACGLGIRDAADAFFDWMEQAGVLLLLTLSRLLMFGVEVFLTLAYVVYARFVSGAENAIDETGKHISNTFSITS